MTNSVYKLSDMSVVIPAYGGASKLKDLFETLLKPLKNLKEIIVVDQTKTDETKTFIKSLKNKKIKYAFSKTPSITIARNLGVKTASKNSKIISFLDDDVINLSPDYFSEILRVFNEHPEAKAVSGVDPTVNHDTKKQGKMHRFIKKIFFLGHYETDKARIISPYGNTYPMNLKRTINAQWLSGVNMAYKKQVFNEQSFDEHLLGYTVVEDLDFSFRLFKKYPNSIFITPYARLGHPQVAKALKKRLFYINQVDHFYFNFKDFNRTPKERLIFAWSVFGIVLLRALSLLSFRKSEFTKFSYFISSLFYCLTNLDKIKKGRVRDFITSAQ